MGLAPHPNSSPFLLHGQHRKTGGDFIEDTPQTQVLEESRARRELAEFRSRYPQVSLSREDLLRLAPEMVGEQPKTLTEAYRCWQEAEKDQELARLRTQLAAQAQNQENRAASPGSQSDSGAPAANGPYDQFLSAYSG